MNIMEFVLTNFDLRRTARGDAISSLEDAKARAPAAVAARSATQPLACYVERRTCLPL